MELALIAFAGGVVATSLVAAVIITAICNRFALVQQELARVQQHNAALDNENWDLKQKLIDLRETNGKLMADAMHEVSRGLMDTNA